jgi:hypothetical protein
MQSRTIGAVPFGEKYLGIEGVLVFRHCGLRLRSEYDTFLPPACFGASSKDASSGAILKSKSWERPGHLTEAARPKLACA